MDRSLSQREPRPSVGPMFNLDPLIASNLPTISDHPPTMGPPGRHTPTSNALPPSHRCIELNRKKVQQVLRQLRRRRSTYLPWPPHDTRSASLAGLSTAIITHQYWSTAASVSHYSADPEAIHTQPGPASFALSIPQPTAKDAQAQHNRKKGKHLSRTKIS